MKATIAIILLIVSSVAFGQKADSLKSFWPKGTMQPLPYSNPHMHDLLWRGDGFSLESQDAHLVIGATKDTTVWSKTDSLRYDMDNLRTQLKNEKVRSEFYFKESMRQIALSAAAEQVILLFVNTPYLELPHNKKFINAVALWHQLQNK